jgi:hypothetical protein
MRRSERLALAAFGYALCLSAMLVAPRTARATAFPTETPLDATLPSAPANRQREDVAPLDIVRDPFISQGGSESVATAPSSAPLVSPASAPRTLSQQPTVRALVTGPHSYALVEVGGAVRIVAPGDDLFGRRVAQIDLDGIRFEGGARLPLTVPAP